jgi:outer membrane immunogenic protein
MKNLIYLGANVGYGAGRNPGTVELPAFSKAIHYLGPLRKLPPGGLGGFQFGYNWQLGHVVLGLEADGQWAGQT